MRISNLNPSDEIGASAWLAEIDGHQLLMDAGTHPKRAGRESLPLYPQIQGSVDAIAISHCHHDHVGSLPVAVRRFPEAHVLMTELSYFLVERVLHNSVNVMTRQRDEVGIKDYPLYTHDEVDDISALFQGFRCQREIEWAAFTAKQPSGRSPTLEFLDAGHALGSAGMMVRGQKETLFYTGDVSFRDQTILKGAAFEDVQADVLVMETTRGARATPVGFSREAETARLAEAMRQVLKRKGSVLIPTFALGRTQEILALLAGLMDSGELTRQPIYIGGLGRVFTEIYDLQAHRAHRNLSNLRLTEALQVIVLEKREIERMRMKGSRVFVLTAGMMTEHTAAHDLAMRMIGEEKHGIFFVGYADPETPGGRVKQSKPGDTFELSPSAGNVTHRCEVKDFDLTAHANREELIDFVGRVSPQSVILGHGDPVARSWFAEEIRRLYPAMRIFQPKPGETVDPLA